ncbi:phage baseplate protein [Chryseobacterium vrystaatense]|uniref:Baseplate structural protein Gp10 C-terminal domain-containing protein n=1 Tax=Chryseobacterium vrystaatense TaxID=307480 RepID=A0ABR4UP09_9FLAO|nr:hypothetical protein [Chryseobacterium vrystaatense]KFF26800.1 hypothetical protein IW16_05800 [Chryseobacterium vrystaatense]
MKYNFKFLQTGGMPLTNDLMNTIEEAYEIFEVLGDLAGDKTILAGCETVGSSVNPGVVTIEGKLYYFEGGVYSPTATVYIHKEDIPKTFQDQLSKALIEKRTVKFGTGAVSYNWSEFLKLETLRNIQVKVNNTATQIDLSALTARIEKLEQKTAPIINGGIVVAWRKPAAEIPAGWKECLDFRGKTIVGWSPNESEFNNLGGEYGSKTHTLNIDQMPRHSHQHYWTIGSGGASGRGGTLVDGWRSTSEVGGNQPHNNIQPSRIALYIEPNFQ